MNAAPPTGLRRYLIALVSLTLVQVVATMGFNQASVLAPAAAPELGVAAADVAYYVSLVYLAAMVSTLGGGVLNRRLGPIRFIQTGLTVAALGSFLFAAGGVALAALSAFVVGLGSGPLTIASSHILARVSPPRLANVTFSLKQSGVPLGFAICGAALPSLALDLGWRWAAASIGFVSIATAIAVDRERLPAMQAIRGFAAVGDRGRARHRRRPARAYRRRSPMSAACSNFIGECPKRLRNSLAKRPGLEKPSSEQSAPTELVSPAISRWRATSSR
jgi:MFS family permease